MYFNAPGISIAFIIQDFGNGCTFTMKKIAVLVFSGYNKRGVIAFCRVLKARGVSFAIIAKSEADTIFRSEYASEVVGIRHAAALVREDLVHQIRLARARLNADKYFIAPSTESLNRFLLANRQVFTAEDCIVPLVEESIYKQLSDKYRFTAYCQEHGVRVPQQIETITSFPVVAKPGEYWSRKGGAALYPVIINDAAGYADFAENNDESEYFYQEYVGGQSYYLLYYFARDGEVLSYSQKNLIQQPEGKSVIAAVSCNIHKQTISSQYIELFSGLGYFGLVMVEVKLYQGEYYMIEANPRFWGPSQLFVDAGCPLFEAYLSDFGVSFQADILEHQPSEDEVRYCWLGGMADTDGKQRELTFHDYDRESFMKQFPEWLAADVYNRPDTNNLFMDEAENGVVKGCV